MQIICKFVHKCHPRNPFGGLTIECDELEKFNGFPVKATQLEWISAEIADKWRPAADANDR